MEDNTIDLFDDVLSNDIFKDTDADILAKKDLKKEEQKKEEIQFEDSDESTEEETTEEVEKEEVEATEESESEEQESEELTEEDKDLLQQVVDLKEMGALFLPDDYEVESLEKAIQDSEAYRNDVAVKTVFNKIPDVEIPGIGNAKDLFAYMFEHGGDDVAKFRATFGVESFNPSNYDLEKEEDRRKVLDLFYAKKGFNESKRTRYIDKLVADLEDETEAKEALNELQELDKIEKQKHLQELKNQQLEKERLAEEAFNQQNYILEKNDVVGGYPLSKDEKPKALNSLYRQVNVGGEIMSEFDYRLKGVVLRNPELTLALSAILNTLAQDPKNKQMYFDLSKFEKREKTKAVSKLKEITSRVTAGKRKLNSRGDEDLQTKDKGFNWGNVVDYPMIP